MQFGAIWPAHGGGRPPVLVWTDRLSRVLAGAGGIVIFAVALTVTASVIMRNIGLRGISGDFELVEMSCAFAAGLFLPLCQLTKGHVMVDLFTNWMPPVVTAQIDRIWLLAFAIGWAILCYFMIHGLIEMRDYGDRSMLMSLPLWWAYVPAVLGAGGSSLIAFAQTIVPSKFTAVGG